MTHTKRHRTNTPKPPEADWKRALQKVLDQHNDMHASKNKTVSFKTRQDRANGIFRIFTLVRAMGFKLAPQNLGGRHIRYLMRYWTADPTLEPELRAQGMRLRRFVRPVRALSAAYIQQQLSFLRVYAGWIGKPGMVLSATGYVNDPALVKRSIVAQRERSWSAAGVDIAAAIATVQRIDPRVALQLEVMFAFGLRRKEAVMFNPALAEVPAYALPAGAAPGTQYLMFIRVKRGTKGGRGRFTAIRSDFQRAALERAQAAAPGASSHIGQPGRSLKQALARFDYVMRRAGITRDKLGVTGHGLRHDFSSDLYVELTGLPPPIAGGPRVNVDLVNAAYLEVARQIGHARPQISGAYLGGRRSSPRTDGETGARWRKVSRGNGQRGRRGLRSWRHFEVGSQRLHCSLRYRFVRSVGNSCRSTRFLGSRPARHAPTPDLLISTTELTIQLDLPATWAQVLPDRRLIMFPRRPFVSRK
jgi:hypothetical protein